MTNYLKKIIATVALGMVCVTPVLAKECRYGQLSEITKSLSEAGAKVSELPESLVKVLVEKKGPPPGAEGEPFTVTRIDLGDNTALVVVQDGCIQDKVGPVPSQLIDNTLGIVNG